MGKAAGSKRRKQKKINYNRNKRQQWKKKFRRPKIDCDVVEAAWDKKTSISRNLTRMGLAYDPNKSTALRIPSSKERMITQSLEEGDDMDLAEDEDEPTHVVEKLRELSKIKVPKVDFMSDDWRAFSKYMVNKYGDNYKAMAKDIQNHYQLTPKQIQKKINLYVKVTKTQT